MSLMEEVVVAVNLVRAAVTMVALTIVIAYAVVTAGLTANLKPVHDLIGASAVSNIDG